MKSELTGRQRFRLWRGKLVLQLEYEHYVTKIVGELFGKPRIDGKLMKGWKDAEVQDLAWKIKED